MIVPLNRIMTTQANRFDSNLESPKSQDSISRSRYYSPAVRECGNFSTVGPWIIENSWRAEVSPRKGELKGETEKPTRKSEGEKTGRRRR